jgi:hypothetical protein
VHARLFRPLLSEIMPHSPPVGPKLRQAFEKLEAEITQRLKGETLCLKPDSFTRSFQPEGF